MRRFKGICHNVCVLISAMSEFGTEPIFIQPNFHTKCMGRRRHRNYRHYDRYWRNGQRHYNYRNYQKIYHPKNSVWARRIMKIAIILAIIGVIIWWLNTSIYAWYNVYIIGILIWLFIIGLFIFLIFWLPSRFLRWIRFPPYN